MNKTLFVSYTVNARLVINKLIVWMTTKCYIDIQKKKLSVHKV